MSNIHNIHYTGLGQETNTEDMDEDCLESVMVIQELSWKLFFLQRFLVGDMVGWATLGGKVRVR